MRIEFTRSGGFAGLRISRVLDTDAMPEAQALELKQLVESADFFGLPESFSSGGADKFQYKITIESDGRTHTVEADERAVPPALAPLVKRLEAASRERP
jgi:hypothetical protein